MDSRLAKAACVGAILRSRSAYSDPIEGRRRPGQSQRSVCPTIHRVEVASLAMYCNIARHRLPFRSFVSDAAGAIARDASSSARYIVGRTDRSDLPGPSRLGTESGWADFETNRPLIHSSPSSRCSSAEPSREPECRGQSQISCSATSSALNAR